MEEVVARVFSGTTPEEVSSVRASAQTDLPVFLRMITGDTSRYSDRDVALAKDAQKATHPTASQDQIIAAYSNMARVAIRDTFRAMKLAGQEMPFKFDNSAEDAANLKTFVAGLRSDGMSEVVIRELLTDLESFNSRSWLDRVGLPADLTADE
jgi:hypothetical protein